MDRFCNQTTTTKTSLPFLRFSAIEKCCVRPHVDGQARWIPRSQSGKRLSDWLEMNGAGAVENWLIGSYRRSQRGTALLRACFTYS